MCYNLKDRFFCCSHLDSLCLLSKWILLKLWKHKKCNASPFSRKLAEKFKMKIVQHPRQNHGFELILKNKEWMKKKRLNQINENGLSFMANSDPKPIPVSNRSFLIRCVIADRLENPFSFCFTSNSISYFNALKSIGFTRRLIHRTPLGTFEWIKMLCFRFFFTLCSRPCLHNSLHLI